MDEKFTFIDVNTISSCHIESAEHRCLTKSAVIPQAQELVLTTCYYSPNYRLWENQMLIMHKKTLSVHLFSRHWPLGSKEQ